MANKQKQKEGQTDQTGQKTPSEENIQPKVDEQEQKGEKSSSKEAVEILKEVGELTETLQRVQAEFENYQKRVQKQNEEFRQYANSKLMEEILPTLDTLEQGVIHNKGFVGVQKQIMQTLGKNGLEKIAVKEGDDFDHETMEAMMRESNEKIGDGRVAKVLLGGYKLNGKILRHTKVSVNKLEKKNEEKNETNEENGKKVF
ncbi:MAG: nucleotide exchange factor GrpE [Candidatus Diapherotrites archaeon]|nr:nucleotide exchange factor GrpE [Candidatus Diapherotrites archaeon]